MKIIIKTIKGEVFNIEAELSNKVEFPLFFVSNSKLKRSLK